MWSSLLRRRPGTRRPAPIRQFRPRLFALEGRLAPAVYTVTNTGDNNGENPAPGAGTGTLRQAIIDANHNGGADEIRFALPGSGPYLIQLQMPSVPTTTALGLPTITDSVFLNGWGQVSATYNGPPVIQIDGSKLIPPDSQSGANGLNIAASNCTVTGLSITGFKENPTLKQANGGIGILIGNSAGSANYNWITGNWIGLTPSGSVAGNEFGGVLIAGGNFNYVGDTGPGPGRHARNVISGNGNPSVSFGQNFGVGLGDVVSTANNNFIQGNFIGTDSQGGNSVPKTGNVGAGVAVFASGQNFIGGKPGTNQINYIAGNGGHGIEIFGGAHLGLLADGANANVVQGNFIGVNAARAPNSNVNAPMPNGGDGVYLSGGFGNVLTQNVISNNAGYGVELNGEFVQGNIIQANYVGVATDGATAQGNGSDGVILESGASSNRITGNTISANAGVGVSLYDSETTSNVIQGNLIGTSSGGSTGVGNHSDGVYIADGAGGNVIGGLARGQGNVISDNDGSGVSLSGAGGGNVIAGNLIGRGSNNTALPNTAGYGVNLQSGVGYTFVVNNTISFASGFRPVASSSPTNYVQGNKVIPLQLTAVGADAGGAPQVKVFDTAGQLVRSLVPYALTFKGGVRVAVGDVNGDGTDDIITAPGAGLASYILVFSGATGGHIATIDPFRHTFVGGSYVAVGNFDADPQDEVVVAQGAGGEGMVRIFNISGRGGVQIPGPLGQFSPFTPKYKGAVIVAAGNWNGTGPDEVIVASSVGNTSKVLVMGLVNNVVTPLTSLTPFASGPALTGSTSLAAADLNNNGTAEIIVGQGAGGTTLVQVYTGGTTTVPPALLASVNAYGTATGGPGVRVGTLDTNGDGKADLLLTAPGAGGTGPEVIAFTLSGTTLIEANSYFAFDVAVNNGLFIAGG